MLQCVKIFYMNHLSEIHNPPPLLKAPAFGFFGQEPNMKFLITLIAIFTSTLAFASKASKISCEITHDGDTASVTFQVFDLNKAGKAKLDYDFHAENEPILVEASDDNGLLDLLNNMNGQGGDLRSLGNGDIELVGDGDGCTYLTLHLYKDSGFKKGWINDKGSESGNWYSDQVICSVE